MKVDYLSLITILGMAAVTYLTRAGGLWMMARVKPSPRVEAWLRHVPGALLVSIVAPAVLKGGATDLLAAGITALFAYRTKSLVLTMIFGVVLVLVFRNVI